jgi:hypothetical protein
MSGAIPQLPLYAFMAWTGRTLPLLLPYFLLQMIQFYEQGRSNTSRVGTHVDSFRKTPAKSSSYLLANKHKRNVEQTHTHGTKDTDVSLLSPYDTIPATFFRFVVTTLELLEPLSSILRTTIGKKNAFLVQFRHIFEVFVNLNCL